MSSGAPDGHWQVSSCCKHFAAYSLESWEGMDRYHFDAICTPQDLTDTYLVAFEACISPSGAGASGAKWRLGELDVSFAVRHHVQLQRSQRHPLVRRYL